MSMPSINLHCDKCDFHGCDTVLWGDYRYIDENGEYSIDRELGWCFECNELTAIESFKGSKEIIEEIEKITKGIKADYQKSVILLLTRNAKNNKKYDIDKVSKLSKKLYINGLRIGTEKCLKCGSVNVTPFDGDYSLEYEGLNYQGRKHTGFVHPECGGEIIATPNPWRFNKRFITKYYAIDGTQVNTPD
jgi:hypothetical protein